MTSIHNTSGRRILIVDDDPVFLALVKGLLQGTGYPLLSASDALQATALAVREQPDLVLLDINIPAGNGLIVLKRLKSNALTRHIPVIIVSASGQDAVAAEARELGAAAFLLKPITHTGLLAAIERVLQRE